MQSPIQSYLDDLYHQLINLRSGELASYIPELTKANPEWFGICLVTLDGEVYTAGDAAQLFTIQSISKPFVYATALADHGQDYVSARVGVEPSGDAFNSISLNPQTGAPLNPMINAGAIASASMVAGATAGLQWERIAASLEAFIGHPISVDENIYHSESDTGFRNRAIAWMLKNFGIIEGEPMPALENYFRQCSVLVDCRDLAFMAATLANGGVHPLTGQRALPQADVERVLSVMATCGMYDYAGSWLYEVGMPAKSGVGGGIIAVLPGRFGIGIFSPLLDEKGNSVRGIEACKRLSRDFSLHVFNQIRKPSMVLGRIYTAADAPSHREHLPALHEYFQQHAHRIKYLCLQGFIALDGVEFVIRKMTEMAEDSHSFILDMNQVEGISASAARLLNQARLNLRTKNIAVVFSRLRGRKEIMEPLRKPVGESDTGFLAFEDNDLAVEWCENRLLSDNIVMPYNETTLADNILFKGIPADLIEKVESVSQMQVFAQGEQILTAGQASDNSIYFILSGDVSILVTLPDGGYQRIASLGPGMHFGEMAMLNQTTRSASVFANTQVHCWILQTTSLNNLAKEFPQLKIQLLENLSNDLAAKLRRATEWISALA